MSNRQKTFLINVGFVVFAAFGVEICHAVETGKFNFGAVIAGCALAALLAFIFSVIRKIIR
jgi:hypothetical protein